MRQVPLAFALALLAGSAMAAPPLGLNVHQSQDVGLDVTRDAKIHWVRIDLNWIDAEPSQGQFDWTRFDAIVDGAKARGLDVLAVVAYGPTWASSGDTKGDGPTNDVPAAGTYAAFVTAVATHFAGRVTHYELWNEPNLAQFFEGQPQDYIDRVLVPGADALHAACPTCKVVGPALASVGTEYATWLDATLAAAASKIDVVSGHSYAQFTQDDPGAGTTSDSFLNKLEQHRKIVVGGVTVYEGPLSYKEVMDKHGVTKPFWLTETGKTAAYGDQAAMAAQATYYQRVLEAMPTRAWWETTIFYEAFDEPNSGNIWGVTLHDPDGGYHAKPAMDVLKNASAFLDAGIDATPPDAGSDSDSASGSDSGSGSGSDSGSESGSESGSGSASGSGSDSAAPSGSSGCDASGGSSTWIGLLLAFVPLLRRRRVS